jgi:hypothetical protein
MTPRSLPAAYLALALARAADPAAAENLVAQLDKTFPLDTLARRHWLPTSVEPDRTLARLGLARAA